jgi:DNA polymerase-3 subunit gamma/tau
VEYQALYRKYRPGRFDEVIGQDHVTHTLAREIVEGRVAHAYLFAGPRGTGKTTTARLLAKSLNCPQREKQGEPCGTCASCTAVTGSYSMDVMELDAASHNKVEDVRDLRASVSTVASVGGAKRVFILDEAHMLTKSASNALLKTLEEPPDHVHFVLATTEPYRLLDTIRSRSQRFDFHLIPTELIAEHLNRISGAEGYRSSPEALLEVARRAAGSVRDALSLLEQVAALDGSVTREGIRDALGVAGPDAIPTLVKAVIESDARLALELIAGLAASGVDLRRFAGDAMGFFRGVFLTMYTPNVQGISDEPAEVLEGWREASRRLPSSTAMRAIDLLGEALVRLREGREERMMLELAVLKLVRPELDTDSDALLNRIERLERRLSRAQPAPEPPPAEAPPLRADETLPRRTPRTMPTPEPPVQEVVAEEPAIDSPPAAGDRTAAAGATPLPDASGGTTDASPTAAELDRIWPQLVAGVRDEMGVVRGALFRDAIPGGVEGSTLVFTIPAGLDFHLQKLSSDRDLHSYLADLAERLLGKRVEVSFRAAEDRTRGPVPIADLPMEPLPDKESLPEAPPTNTDALSLLEKTFGATVVEED